MKTARSELVAIRDTPKHFDEYQGEFYACREWLYRNQEGLFWLYVTEQVALPELGGPENAHTSHQAEPMSEDAVLSWLRLGGVRFPQGERET
jgi:hypothetical protein